MPEPGAATVLAVLHQLERTQWLAPRQIEALQYRQLEALLRHAFASVPFYRRQWALCFDPSAPLDARRFRELPVLSRRELQQNYEELKSERLPPQHGTPSESSTSGSTGAPVRMLKTGLTDLLWRAITLREHEWHGRDLGAKLAAIRQGVAAGSSDNWGHATRGVVATGPLALLPVSAGADEQLAWLQRERPNHLLTYPSIAAELARRSLGRGIRLEGLREVRTLGEALPGETRDLCRQAWGVPVTDMYSADETGYIALQCPVHGGYHVQSENVLVEILDPDGRNCEPGQAGRVVVTCLHNFATPLVRYEIGDYAEAGSPCPCGRGLPVLARVLGRVRNMLVTASGERYWPTFGVRSLTEVAPILQAQFVQKSLGLVEARLVVAAPLGEAQEAALRSRVLERLPRGMELRLAYLDSIPRSKGGKFEDFVSELS